MADELDSSKIDGLVMVGMTDATQGVSKIDGIVMVGASEGTMAVSKIDAFIMVGSSPVAAGGSIQVSMSVF